MGLLDGEGLRTSPRGAGSFAPHWGAREPFQLQLGEAQHPSNVCLPAFWGQPPRSLAVAPVSVSVRTALGAIPPLTAAGTYESVRGPGGRRGRVGGIRCPCPPGLTPGYMDADCPCVLGVLYVGSKVHRGV